jgi:nicotinamidase-related amidase
MLPKIEKKNRAQNGTSGEMTDAAEVTLLIIDPQNDFHPGGTLAIPTADSDAERVAAFIRKHARQIDRVVITLDSHQRIHIAHGIFWVNDAGEHPPAFTLISSDDIARGTWRASDAGKQTAAEAYARKLEEGNRFTLCIWPEHCIIGSPGHNVRPVLLAAVNEWAESRMREVVFVWKGQNCLTEMYSALRAEVPVPSDERTLLNAALLRTLQGSGRIVVCGQALSHCVNFTVRDLVASYADGLDRISILRDGTSAVPGFEDAGDTFLRDMQSKGVRIVTTDSCAF